MSHGIEPYTAHDTERQYREPVKSSHRTPFARDRARILHSSALRRMGGKTQVLGAGFNDFTRTRLTHSLEVAQIGREIAAAVGCDPDIVDAACLSHDLGHPPFGHHGEDVLHALCADMGGFEGNAQTLRILTRLEPKITDTSGAATRSVGLNLTRAVLDACIKYPWRSVEAVHGSHKFGVYDDDAAAFTFARSGAPAWRQSFEAQVMDIADDVAYSTHDVEDAIAGRFLSPEALEVDAVAARVIDIACGYAPGARREVMEQTLEQVMADPLWPRTFTGSRAELARLKNLASSLIGEFVVAVSEATLAGAARGQLRRHHGTLMVPPGALAKMSVLKAMAVHFVMNDQRRLPVYDKQRTILCDLFGVLRERAPGPLETTFAEDYLDAADDAGRVRAVVDQIASLSDTRAIRWHQELFAG